MYIPYLRQRLLVLMPGRPLWLTLALVLILAVSLVTYSLLGSTITPGPVTTLDLGKLPLSFVPNAGQTDPSVHFQAYDVGGTIFFTADQVVLSLPGSPVLRLRFEGANPAPTVTGVGRLPGIVNYLVGDDSGKWHTNLPSYAGIVYQQLYPGIDLRYDGTSGRLKGTYLVAPGADPTLIRWRHEGVTSVRMDKTTGDLLVTLPTVGGSNLVHSEIVERAPIAWQDLNGERIPVTASYVLADDGGVGFALGSYDPTRPLTIDPTLIYSTYLGGSNLEDAEGIAVDSAGNVYVIGTTFSTDFPTQDPLYTDHPGDDVFVTKISAAGDALIYSTYLGGGKDDEANGIAVDSVGNAYVTGTTSSTDFPTQNPLQGSCALFMGVCTGDAFVAKLSADGSHLVYSTYLGGSGREDAEGIAVDSAGGAYVIGTTFSLNFPTENPLQGIRHGPADAFVAKLNDSGSHLVYSTYLGGRTLDSGAGIAVDDANHAYVIGTTFSPNFPTENPLQGVRHGPADAFVAKLDDSGSHLVYSTYLGGSTTDFGAGIAVDDADHAYVTGETYSPDFPTESPLQATFGGGIDAFVAKLNAGGSGLVYSTYLGGDRADRSHGIAVDSTGDVYITGDTQSTDFPLEDPLQVASGGGADAFVTKLNTDGSAMLYSTYLGGSAGDQGTGIAVDNVGHAFVTGITHSFADFPTQNPWQATYGGGPSDAFVVKISDAGSGPLPPPPPAPNLVGSYKSASQHILAPGEVLTYTITLHNSGTDEATADVTDQLPAQVNYVVDSATDGGVHDPGAGTLSWSDVTVPMGSDVSLSFAVTATVNAPTLAVNTATITANGDTFDRHAPVLLIPERPPDDHIPPVVHSLTIDEQDVLTSPTVTLHISATDNISVTRMYLREWRLTTTPFPHWRTVRSSGWVPYQADYPWTLGSKSGTHFVGVWVADEAHNTSWLNRRGLDFASLLQPGSGIPRFGMVPYLVYYDSGVDVSAVLTPTTGDPDLYVWYPGSFFEPDQKSTLPGTATDVVTFTTPSAGTYLFLVHGYTAATYDLSITPPGGPRALGMVVAHAGETGQVNSSWIQIASNKNELTVEPVLPWSGLDPMSDPAIAPASAPSSMVYLPVIVK